MKIVICLLSFIFFNCQSMPPFKIKASMEIPHTSEALYAQIDEKNIGSISYKRYPESSDIYIKVISVEPEYRNSGVATVLMNLALCRIKSFNVSTVWLRALPLDNKTELNRLVNFYEKFDFLCVEKIESSSTSVLMKKKL